MPKYIVNSAKFRPYSYNELLQPAQMATEEHRLLEENLGDLSTKSSIWDGLIDPQRDSDLYNQYRAYSDDLAKQVDLLSKEGLTPASRTGLLNMKRRYSSEIAPIELAASRRDELTKEQREALKKDPSIMFDIDYSRAALSDLVRNPNASYRTLSGSELAKKSAAAASTLAKTIQSDPQYSNILGNQYVQERIQLGYTPEQIMGTILDREDAPEELKNIVNSIYAESGLDTWDTDTRSKAQSYINRGLYEAIGTQKFDNIANRGYMSPLDAERLSISRESRAKEKGTILPDGSKILTPGGGKVLRVYPDGRTEFIGSGSSGMDNKSFNSFVGEVAKVRDKPFLVANTKGTWRVGEPGENVPSTWAGMTRSEAVSRWGNYTLDNVKPENIVTDYSEIPREALIEIGNLVKDENLDISSYNIVRIKADDKRRKVGDYDYALVPKTDEELIREMTPKATPETSTSGYSGSFLD